VVVSGSAAPQPGGGRTPCRSAPRGGNRRHDCIRRARRCCGSRRRAARCAQPATADQAQPAAHAASPEAPKSAPTEWAWYTEAAQRNTRGRGAAHAAAAAERSAASRAAETRTRINAQVWCRRRRQRAWRCGTRKTRLDAASRGHQGGARCRMSSIRAAVLSACRMTAPPRRGCT
jgi:hypothetical protein